MARISDFMTKDVVSVGSNTTLPDAAKLMRDKDIGILPVVDGDQLKGMVTDRDLVVRGFADGDGSSKTVDRVMSKDVFSLAPDDDAQDAKKRMSDRGVRRLPVVDHGKLVGMVSVGDLAVRADEKLAGKVMEETGPGKK
jgi:CBS domain-containing protein